MSISPKVTRFLFYGLLVSGGLLLCGTLTMRSLTTAGDAVGMPPIWLASLCCIVPMVLAGLALANESR